MINSAPTSVLSKIVARRRQTANQIEVANLPKRERGYHSLKTAIRGQKFPALILECKAASPSKGQLANDYDPVKLASTYRHYGATAISVLVESEHFSGSYAHLKAVSEHVKLPVLCKDFIISRAQIAAAHAYGADAVLLMLQVLDDAEYRDLADYAAQLHLEVLTEVSTPAECERANRLGAELVDINHRDLHSLEIDMERCYKLRPYLDQETLVVAASGMEKRSDLERIAKYCDAYLVGSSLSGAPDLEMALKSLIYGSFKVCGLRSVEIAKIAATCGASYGGLIWHEPSPRKVDLDSSARIIADTGNRLKFLAVTCEDNLSRLGEIGKQAKAIGAWGIQLHTPVQEKENEFVNRVRDCVNPDLALVRVVTQIIPLSQLQTLLENPVLAWVMMDSPRPGSGESWNWSTIPADLRQKLWVAGGLGAESIEAAKEVGFVGYDINSGVETKDIDGQPVKNPHLIESLFKKVRAYIPESSYGN